MGVFRVIKGDTRRLDYGPCACMYIYIYIHTYILFIYGLGFRTWGYYSKNGEANGETHEKQTGNYFLWFKVSGLAQGYWPNSGNQT